MSEIIRMPSVGDLVADKYRLTDEIGRGGFGVVYRALQEGINRTVAVKMLLPHAMSHEGVIERFKREAHLAGSLSHPNTVKIFDTGVYTPEPNVKPLPFITMEYLEGETLQSYLHRHRKLTMEDATDLLLQTLSSLGEAHRKGIIHRDIKPENIFICNRNVEDRVIKVLDFGIAKAVAGDWDPQARERLTRTGFVAGTAEYMAPEQASGEKDIKPALDVYAMGCLAYQMFAGKVPYEGNSPMDIAIKHISDPIPRLPPPHRDKFIEKVIRKAMAKKPEHRFRDAKQFSDVLKEGSLGDSAVEMMITDETEALSVDEYHSYDDPFGEAPTKVIPVMVDPEEYMRRQQDLYDDVDAPNTLDNEPAVILNDPSSSSRRNRLIIAAIAAVFFLLVIGIGVGIAGFNYLTSDQGMPTGPDNPPTANKAPDENKGENKGGDDKGGPELALRGDSIPAPDIEGDTKEPPVKVETKPLAEHIWLISTPKGATLTIDGEKVDGKTPLRVYRPEEAGPTSVIVLKRRRLRGYLKIDWANNKTGANIPIKLSRQNTTKKEDRNPVVADKGSNKGDDKGTNKGSDKGTNKGTNKGSDKGTDKGNDGGSNKPKVLGSEENKATKRKPKILGQD